MNNGDKLREISRQAKMDKRTKIRESKGYELLIKELEQIAAMGRNNARILSNAVMCLFEEDGITFNQLQGALEGDGIVLKAVYDSGTDPAYAIFKFSWN